MNTKMILGGMSVAVFVAVLSTTILSIDVTALGPSGKCYVSCTGGGIPFHLYEHNFCVSACMLGDSVHGPGGGLSLEPLLPETRPKQSPGEQSLQRR